jgi:hypothetical protein
MATLPMPLHTSPTPPPLFLAGRRAAFNDAALAVDTSGFYAQGLQACIEALGDSWWEVSLLRQGTSS